MRQIAALFAWFAATAVFAGPNVVVISSPKGLVQTIGGAGAADSFTIANVGDANAVLTFQRSGSFFNISTFSLVLAPGATQTINIQGASQPSQGILVGSVTISGSGTPASGIDVPVRLMAGPVPAGTVNAQASIGGLILFGLANLQHSASIGFHNSGNAQMMGMAVGDTEWLVPQSGFVTVNANQNASASFSVDASKRPDSAAPMGGTTGNLSLRFLSGNATAQSVSVSIVDVVSPDVAPGEAPPLAPGELALFVPGLVNRSGIASDFFLAGRRGDTAITDLKLYYTQAIAGSSSLAAILAQPASSLAIWFPSIMQTVFKRGDPSGALQMRGSQTANVSIAAIEVASPGDGRIFSSPSPVLRSDRAIGANETMILTGVDKTDTLTTALYLQEMSGAATSVQSDFFDLNGNVVGTRRTDNVGAFRSIEILDAVPAGARSVRLTNLGAGRIGATAVTSDNATNASWSIVDSNRDSPAGTSVWVIPIVTAAASGQPEVFVTDAASNNVSVTLDNFTVNAPGRRHAVRPMAASTTLAPLQTMRTAVAPANALFRLTGPAGAVSASARMVMTSAGRIGSFGASFPVVPVSNALGASQGTRFTAVDDTLHGSRSSLILAEVGGATTTVHVTLRFVFVAGQAVSSQAISSKDFTVNPGQFLVIPSLAATV